MIVFKGDLISEYYIVVVPNLAIWVCSNCMCTAHLYLMRPRIECHLITSHTTHTTHTHTLLLWCCAIVHLRQQSLFFPPSLLPLPLPLSLPPSLFFLPLSHAISPQHSIIKRWSKSRREKDQVEEKKKSRN